MADVPLLLVAGHNLLFRACFGTPAQILSRDETAKRDVTTQPMFFALLRKDINDELATLPEVIVIFDGQDGTAGGKDTDPGYEGYPARWVAGPAADSRAMSRLAPATRRVCLMKLGCGGRSGRGDEVCD